jgi:hypothetical protein
VRTPATDLVGIDIPIFAFSHCRDVVPAVTDASGCGVLGAVAHSPEQLAIDSVEPTRRAALEMIEELAESLDRLNQLAQR